jgi:uncharacterized protein YdeI (BOF family)
MNLKYYSILFAIIGISVLYAMTLFSKPVVIELSKLPQYEGKQITTQGIVKNYYSTKYGNQMITIEDNNASATVFSEEEITVEYGDKIRVTGEVQKYNDCWEIIVNDKRSITIIQKWENISMPLWQIVQNPGRYEGLNVNVSGYVDSLYDDYFYLIDEKGDYSILVFYNSYEPEAVYPGQKVSVAGLFSFEKENFRYVLSICDRTHKISPAAGE